MSSSKSNLIEALKMALEETNAIIGSIWNNADPFSNKGRTDAFNEITKVTSIKDGIEKCLDASGANDPEHPTDGFIRMANNLSGPSIQKPVMEPVGSIGIPSPAGSNSMPDGASYDYKDNDHPSIICNILAKTKGKHEATEVRFSDGIKIRAFKGSSLIDIYIKILNHLSEHYADMYKSLPSNKDLTLCGGSNIFLDSPDGLRARHAALGVHTALDIIPSQIQIRLFKLCKVFTLADMVMKIASRGIGNGVLAVPKGRTVRSTNVHQDKYDKHNLRGTKPVLININSAKIKVKSWGKVLPEIVKWCVKESVNGKARLCSLEASTTRRGNFIIGESGDTMSYPFKARGLFIEGKMSPAKLVKFVDKMVIHFPEIITLSIETNSSSTYSYVKS